MLLSKQTVQEAEMSVRVRVLFLSIVALVAFSVQAQAIINGCFDKNGTLRIVLAGEACKNNETAISWNATGPQGIQGVTGRDGRDGRDGLPGKDGANGKDGKDGSTIPPLVTVGNATFDPITDGAGSPGFSFEIKDFSFGVENPTTIGSATGGAGSGKIKFNEFTIKKTTDAASPLLFKNCAAGAHYPKVTIVVRKAGSDVTTTITLGTVFVSAVKYVPSLNPPDALEEITVLAGKVQIATTGAPECWDQVHNSNCNGDF